MIATENQTRTRTGRVTLKVSGAPERYESFLVHEEDGRLYYYLGAPARTSDGWVSLSEDHRPAVAWDAR